MIVLSLNVCGIRDKVKRRRVANICGRLGVSFMGLQETRVSRINLFDLRCLWGNFTLDFAVSSSRGSSGGILSLWDLWDPSAFVSSRIVSMENALIVEGERVFKKLKCFMVNIYAPQQEVQKRDLWGRLSGFMQDNEGEYVMFGDFNANRSRGERRGCAFSPREAFDFNSFIIEAGLMEVDMGRFAFTRVSGNGEKMSKIDRFLNTDGVALCFPELHVTACANTISDHRTICMREVAIDYGPRPFRFFNSWMEELNFELILRDSWNSLHSHTGQEATINFKNKLKKLKLDLKAWWITLSKEKNSEKEEVERRLRGIDENIDKGCASQEELYERSILTFQVLDDLFVFLQVLKEINQLINLTLSEGQNRKSLSGSTTFNRIELPLNGDPLNGLYVGGHGNGIYTSEVIQLRRKFGHWKDDDDVDDGMKDFTNLEFYEYVEAVKITGDPQIPAGQVAFRAKVGTQYQLPQRGIIPEEFGVIARYNGQVRIADPGFQNPRWVDGELVILDGKVFHSYKIQGVSTRVGYG